MKEIRMSYRAMWAGRIIAFVVGCIIADVMFGREPSYVGIAIAFVLFCLSMVVADYLVGVRDPLDR